MQNLQLNESNDNDDEAPGLLDRYIPLVEFLGDAIGPNCELVLHDLDVPDRSIVAIANGHISGREIGGPVTDFALRFMRQGASSQATSLSGYRAINSSGRICRSSSYFIRDENGELRGMLCINVDITEMVNVRDAVERLLGEGEEPKQRIYPDKATAMAELASATNPNASASSSSKHTMTTPAPKLAPVPSVVAKPQPSAQTRQEGEALESLRSSLENLLESMLDTAIAKQHVAPDRMQVAERIEVVSDLDEAGFFLLKGGIAAAAQRLKVSEPTVYRYLVRTRN
ncbi:helix-turn-helix transcriptional regulator [Corynebacterium epidermidicanis]|nr:helix-turn-helix transcriptional regulator [Corynebacterium epidermidicanis]